MNLHTLRNRIELALCVTILAFAYAISDDPATIFTPKGSIVPDTWTRSEMSQASIDYWNDYVDGWGGVTRLASATQKYNCHGYAWYVSDGGGQVWIGASNITAENVFWNDGSYTQRSGEAYASKVSYDPDEVYEGEFNHSAITTSQSGWYISKWGPAGLARHQYANCPYYYSYTPMRYFEIWTKLRVPGDFATINNAISSAVSGQTIFVSGSNTLTGNVTIPSGVTLKLLSGSTVNFNSYYIDATNGTFDVQNGTTVCRTNGYSTYYGLYTSVQPAINAASTGQAVKMFSGTFTESPSISSKSYFTLSGQGQGSTTVNGSISISNSSYIQVSGMTLTGAVGLNYCDHTQVSNLTGTATTLTTNYGGTVNDFGYCTASDIGASFGLNAYGGTGNLYNSSISNGDLAVYLTSNASYNIGTYNVFCHNGYDIYAGDGAYAYAISNFYSYELPGPIYGNVYVTGQNDVCGGYMAAPGTETLVGTSSDQPQDEPKSADDEYLTLLRTMQQEKLANTYNPSNYKEQTQSLIDRYASFIRDGAENSVVKAALSKIAHLFIGLDKKSKFREYVSETLSSGRFGAFAPYFRRYLIWDYVDKKDFDAAVKLADEVLSTADGDNDLSAELLYEKGLIQKYYLGDASKANEMYALLSNRFPSSPLNKFAAVDMNIAGGSSLGEKQVEQTQTMQPDENEVLAYPNPFNPSTKIQFKLKDAGFVSLKIYDILGREVAVLINEEQQAGTHEATWDASKQPSGLYFAKLDVLGKSSVHKMLLVK